MAIWNGLLIYAGLLVGNNWERAVELLEDYNLTVLAAIATLVVVALIRAFRRQRHVDSQERPP